MIRLILKNRSLAENNPLNLRTYQILDRYCEKIGEKAFISWVYKVLDDNE